MQARDKLIIALDVPELKDALALVKATQDACATFKLGLELFLRYGQEGVRQIQASGAEVFLDLKLHDIPNTVHSAMLQVLPLKPKFITVHAFGGAPMLEAAEEALYKTQGSQPYSKILAVSVLTHLGSRELCSMGVSGSASEIAQRLLKPVKKSANFGAVCSPHEAKALRAMAGEGFTLVCPGIRPAMSDQNDQTRIASPREALQGGADYLVVGRPITRAANPTKAARSVINEMESYAKN